MVAGLAIVAAGRSAGGMSFVSVVFIAALVFVAAAAMYRLRRGGRGPRAEWLPRSLRSRVNEAYRREGWTEPYAQGSRRPRPPRRS